MISQWVKRKMSFIWGKKGKYYVLCMFIAVVFAYFIFWMLKYCLKQLKCINSEYKIDELQLRS